MNFNGYVKIVYQQKFFEIHIQSKVKSSAYGRSTSRIKISKYETDSESGIELLQDYIY